MLRYLQVFIRLNNKFKWQSRLFKTQCVFIAGSMVLIGGNMKTLRSLLVVLALSAAAITSASARDSFSLGINIGGPGYYAPPARYYGPPPVIYAPHAYYARPYYAAPRVVYPRPYYAPRASFGYQHFDNGHRHYDNRGRDNHWRGRGHDHGHRGDDRRGHR